MKPNSYSLNEWVNELQRSGVYSFTRYKAQNELGIEYHSLSTALHRLNKQGRILRLRNNFYVIVPLEYQSTGTIPPEWYINDLMAFIGEPYYVGCLSAAAVYGASHQRSQELQVIVPTHIPMIDLASVRIRFLRHSGMNKAITRLQRTQTGDYFISTPEWTAIDLVRFQKYYGSLDAAAVVLSELGEALNVNNLTEACHREPQNALLQRLGWLLDYLGFKQLIIPILSVLEKREVSYIPLNSSLKKRTGTRSKTWRIIVNEKLEVEL